jgi:hypothetical protein
VVLSNMLVFVDPSGVRLALLVIFGFIVELGAALVVFSAASPSVEASTEVATEAA